MTFHTQKTTVRFLFTTAIAKSPPSLKSTMISPVVNFKEGMKMKKQTKTKIGFGSVVKAKDGELEKLTSDGKKQED